MANAITGKIGARVAFLVNLVLLIVIGIGTYFIINKESDRLESELFVKGQNQSLLGAKMIGTILDEAIDNGVFDINTVFDTDYQPIGNFDPPKYHTNYDVYLDKAIIGLQDEFLLDKSVLYAVGSDKNGYIPTHNSRYQQPITGDTEKDRVGNRTKRVYNDPVGLKAAQNTKPKFRQIYHRDTGEVLWDISSPIYVKGKHWGGFRLGISLETIDKAKNELVATLLTIMGAILIISIVLTFIIVNSSLNPFRTLANTANGLAKGEGIQNEIVVTKKDEVGEMQKALESLRLSMLIALKRKRK